MGYQGVACTLRNAKSGQYPGVRTFWMVTKGVPAGPAAAFIKWIITASTTVRNIIATDWIPMHQVGCT